MKYVLGGTEKNIEVVFVTATEYLDNTSRQRKRNVRTNISAPPSPGKRRKASTTSTSNAKPKVVKRANKQKPKTKKKQPVKKKDTQEIEEEAVETNSKNVISVTETELDLDDPIPREIVIETCSRISLNEDDSLLDSCFYLKQARQQQQQQYPQKIPPLQKKRKSKKITQEDAKNTRKLTEFFTSNKTKVTKTKSTSPLKKKKMNLAKKNDKRETPTKKSNNGASYTPQHTSKAEQKKNSRPLLHPDETTAQDSKTTQNITNVKTRMPNNTATSNMKKTLQECENIIVPSSPHTAAATKAKTNSQFNSTNAPSQAASIAPAASPAPVEVVSPVSSYPNNNVHKEVVEDSLEKRLPSFTSTFSDIMRLRDEITLKEIQDLMDQNKKSKEKYSKKEIIAFLHKLDQMNRVMFQEETGLVFKI